jgi:glutaminase
MGTTDLDAAIRDIVDHMARAEHRGHVADYIPALAAGDPARFGIAVALNDGTVVAGGDSEIGFSLQSISKVFTLSLSLGLYGDAIWQRVGKEPSGSAFNSIVQLEYENGVPRNPFINAGAIVVADALLASHEPRETIGEILHFIRMVASDDGIAIDPVIARSETATGFKNFALANYLAACGNLRNGPERALGVYFHQCAVTMNCVQLACAGRYLSNGGVDPVTGRPVISAARARRINALMMTCGQYDGSGEFAFRVGLPAKSGVGGGILCVVPEIGAVATWSPGLNERGNSQLGSVALEELAVRQRWSVFGR